MRQFNFSPRERLIWNLARKLCAYYEFNADTVQEEAEFELLKAMEALFNETDLPWEQDQEARVRSRLLMEAASAAALYQIISNDEKDEMVDLLQLSWGN